MTMATHPMLAGIFSSGAFGYLFDYFVWWALFASLLLHTWCFFRFVPRSKRPRLSLVVGNVLVFLSLLGSVAMVGESYLRFVAVWTDSFGVSLPARRWFALHTNVNAMGCRDHEWTLEKPEGVRRIAFVGDSYTYGWGIEHTEDRFTGLIQTHFDQEQAGAIEVLNVAKPGWTAADEVHPIQDMITVYGADEIVLCYVPNDIEKLIPITPDFNPTRPPDPQFFNPDASPLLDFLYRRFYLPRLPTVRGYSDWLADGFADERIWREHAAQLTDVVAFCREHNTKMRVVLLPFLLTGGTRYDAIEVHGKLRALFEQLDVPVVDMLSELTRGEVPPVRLIVNSLDPHPNEAAHAMIAEAIWNAFYAKSEQ